ncbi:MAG: SGNH/GDSL hydrolase family protein [Ignavibacteria bacterium]|nr:SGNH/GDSL hydrolase family protein [Ignavibacteria bacterium]
MFGIKRTPNEASFRTVDKQSSAEAVHKGQNTRRRPPRFFYMILILLPFLFFFFCEVFLRLVGYGCLDQQWIEVVPGKLMLNPEIARRYFYSNTTFPLPAQDLFFKEKPSGSFRIFILGENSASGFPYLPSASFSCYLEKRLKKEYPASKIEVVNLSLMAVNSFALRDLLPGVLRQKPDLIIIYSGHNEYYGALGAASTLAAGRNRWLINLRLYLERFKTVQLISEAVRVCFRIFRTERKFKAVSEKITSDQQIPYNSSLFRAGIIQFEENLKDMLHMARSAGVPVILGTLVCNLKDQPPFLSSKEVVVGLPKAIDVFKEAVSSLKADSITLADSLFRYARDLDLLRFRAPGQMNYVIKSLAQGFNCTLVSFDSAFDSLSPGGITGNDLMADHLHPNIYGYMMMGELIFKKMKEKGILPALKTEIAELKEKEHN